MNVKNKQRKSFREKYPNKQAVILQIKARDEKDLPLSSGKLHNGAHADPWLHYAGIEYFKTWKNAIQAAGYDYRAIIYKSRSRYPSGKAVIKEILRRNRMEIPLNAKAVASSPGPHRDVTLSSAGKKFFGGWKQAIEAAGLDYNLIKKNSPGRKYPDKASVIKEIRRRASAGKPLYVLSLNVGEHRDAVLYIYSKEYFGSWKLAIKAAGLPEKALKPPVRRIYPDKASIIAGIQKRHAENKPVHVTAITRGEWRDETLWIRGVEYFGSWENAIEVAGLSPDKLLNPTRPSRYPNKTSVIKEIQRRETTGLPLNGLAVAKGSQRDPSLHKHGQKHFGSWQNALEAAGVSFEEVRLKPKCRYPDKDSVITKIKQMYKEGIPLNGLAIAKGKQSDPTLYKCAQKYFGKWETAIETAGISYKEIRAKKRPLRYPDKDAIIREIRRRVSVGLSINGLAVSEGKEADTALYKYAPYFLGSWKKAVSAAGFDYNYLVRKRKSPYPDTETVIAEIRRRHKNGITIRSTHVMKPGKYQDRGLFNSACRYFDNWRKAVQAAGIDYDAICPDLRFTRNRIKDKE